MDRAAGRAGFLDSQCVVVLIGGTGKRYIAIGMGRGVIRTAFPTLSI